MARGNRTGRRAAARKQQPGGLLLSPRVTGLRKQKTKGGRPQQKPYPGLVLFFGMARGNRTEGQTFRFLCKDNIQQFRGAGNQVLGSRIPQLRFAAEPP